MNKEPLSLTGFFAEDVKALLDARLRGAKAEFEDLEPSHAERGG